MNGLKLSKGDMVLMFDIKIPTTEGILFCMHLMCSNNETGLVTTSIDRTHQLLGHRHEKATRATAKHLKWTVEGKMSPCAHCSATKAKQSNVTKVRNHEIASEAGERMFVDMAFVKNPLKLNINVATRDW